MYLLDSQYCTKRFLSGMADDSFEVIDKEEGVAGNLLAYQCYLCTKQYLKIASLQTHMGKIHKTNTLQLERVTKVEIKAPHVCVLCNSAWKNKTYFQRHMKKVVIFKKHSIL